ncbi:hypothetical protein M9Y10_003441 [Tritrichomonas musculus]|uniref:Uncharacterized protein n=1 Tax=Tritrichomonas musculus TaxID=1915356 RepID=A0ABR2JPE1_9EUKA
MSKLLPETNNIDEHYFSKIAKDMIASCSGDGLNYGSIKKYLDMTLNKSVDIIITILNNDQNDCSYQELMKSIKIQPLCRLAEEINNYKKKNSIPLSNMSSERIKKVPTDTFIEQQQKLKLLQDTIITSAKRSKSQKIKSILSSIDLTSPDIPTEKLTSILTIIIQEGEDFAQTRMAKLYFGILKTLQKNEKIDLSIPLEKSERLILQTVKVIKGKIYKITDESIKTNAMQTQLIDILQSQVDHLSNEIIFKNEAKLFEKEIKKNFEENCKYDDLLENLKKAFKKIEEASMSKKELILRNGHLETQNLLLQKKYNDFVDENNQLKQKIQNFQSKKNKRNQ